MRQPGTLADRLRAALDFSWSNEPELIVNDVLDTAGPDFVITPAAVLMAVVDHDEPTVILTLRPDTMRNHAGQISFPGGRLDPHDDGPVGGALREAEEEVGLPPSAVEVVGTSDRYRTITGFEITPVLGVVPPGLPLTPHPREVADLFEAPLHFLLDPANHEQRAVMYEGRERTYYEINWTDRRIWGATAAMLVNLSRRLALVT